MQHRLHLNKRGIRVLGVAESFDQRQPHSTIAGVVMRGDLVIDGFAFGKTTVGGEDATRAVLSLYRRFRRNDINLLMLSGCIISGYNIVDVDSLSERTRRPVVCLTYNETAGIESTLKKRFPGDRKRLDAYHRLGERRSITLRSGHVVYVRTSGMSAEEARSTVDSFTLQGAVPEPVRVARLLARAAGPRILGSSPRGSSGSPGR